MNNKQLQYVIQLAEYKNFSQVAQQQNISQPALSKQIIHLENELGVKLFDRSTSPLSLTPAGEYFVQQAEKLLFEQDLLIKTMERYKSGENGRLVMGVSPFRSLYLMPETVRKIKERFPGLQIILSEYGRVHLLKELSEGTYDFAIMNLPVDEASFETIPLEADTMVVAVPNHLLPCIEQPADTLTMEQCRSLPFVILSPGQEMRQLFDHLCKKHNVQPPVHTEVVGITTAWEMVRAGVAATLIPKQFIRSNPDACNVTLFPLQQASYVRQPAIVLRRGQYLSPYAQYAIDLLKNKASASKEM